MSLIKNINSKNLLWLILLGLIFCFISFITNWLMNIHSGYSPSSKQLFDISFYYFVPVMTWTILSLTAMMTTDKWMKLNKKDWIILLLVLAFVISPTVRVFDILIDFSIKYFFGMIEVNPFIVLQDVWLVVVSSTPMAFLKIISILAAVYFLNSQSNTERLLTILSGGVYHVLPEKSIVCFQANGNYLIVQAENTEYRTRATLKSFESKLEGGFFRIHKSTIVNWRHIVKMKHWRNGEYLLVMDNGKTLTSSQSYKKSIEVIKESMERRGVDKFQPTLAILHPSAS